MNINQLIEHIKSDNLAEAISFQICGMAFIQVKTRDCELFKTLLVESDESPMTFGNRKSALSFVDNLVKEAKSAFFASQQDSTCVPALKPAEGQLNYTKTYPKNVDSHVFPIRFEVSKKTGDKS
jgi:hypothetical protein